MKLNETLDSSQEDLSWTHEELFTSNRDYFAAILRACEEAKATIDVEVYIFSLDSVGQSLLQQLRQAVERQVKVRILVDGIGSPHWVHGTMESLEHQGISTRVYHPVASPWSRWGRKNFPPLARLIKVISSVNRRDHKKVFIIDGKKAFLGGINVSEPSLQWKDVGVLIEGPGIKDLISAFELNWHKSELTPLSSIKELRRSQKISNSWKNPYLELNHTLKLRRQRRKKLIRRIELAKQRVWITNPYWVPTPRFIAALIGAVQRGVDVRLCFPGVSDIFFTRWVGEALLEPLVPLGVKLYEYKNEFIHAKFLIIDDWSRLGSTNLNYRSQYHDLEVDVVLTRKKNLDLLSENFLDYCRQSRLVTIDDLGQRSWMKKIAVLFFLIFKRWI